MAYMVANDTQPNNVTRLSADMMNLPTVNLLEPTTAIGAYVLLSVMDLPPPLSVSGPVCV